MCCANHIKLNSQNNIRRSRCFIDEHVLYSRKSARKSFFRIRSLARIEKNSSKLIIGVGGCVASQEGNAIIKRAPYVDLVFGPQTLHRLAEMLIKCDIQGKPAIVIFQFPRN